MRKGRSAEQMRAMRKKYGLGEFKKGKGPATQSPVSSPKRRATQRRQLDPSRYHGGSNIPPGLRAPGSVNPWGEGEIRK